MIERPINQATGRQDGIYYTFGKSEVCLVLSHILLSLPDDKRKFHKVSSKLADYTNGLRTLASLPKSADMRTALCLIWRNHYLKEFENLLTMEEGQTFLLNLAKTRFKELIGNHG